MTRRVLILVASICFPALLAMAGSKYESGIARLSYLEGRVSFQHDSAVDWSAASINMALQPADRIYTGEDGRAEIQFDEGSVLRLAEKTDIEILTLKEDFIQIRVLAGLLTLNVHNRVHFEVNTPAAAFNTTRNGVYRLLVKENGDTDGIVRKGLLDVASNSLSKRLDAGEQIHVTAGERGTHTVSRYSKRDEWDEWNDRRNADTVADESKKYLPGNVYAGVRELDRYGRWTVVDNYGPAWVPLYVNSGWSPYWAGRWCYRPIWGWTWTSYEPWGWLPYHYGRWSFRMGVGWFWLPGPSYGFHFWSPGLVRFYRGPNWVSWCPLGPGDYYDTNRYFYRSGYNYYLNSLRLIQRRGPEDLANRNVPGAFRTTGTDEFANESLGGEQMRTVPGADQPWRRGRIVSDMGIEPTARSFSPAPDRPVVRPSSITTRPAVVRTEPADSSERRYSRITTPGIAPVPPIARQERETGDGTRSYVMDSRGGGSSLTRRSDASPVETEPSRPSTWYRAPDPADSGRRTTPPTTRSDEALPSRVQDAPASQDGRREYNPSNRRDIPPVSPGNRYERPRPEYRQRSEPPAGSTDNAPRWSPRYEPRSSPRIERMPQGGPGRSSTPSWGGGGERTYGGGGGARPSVGGGGRSVPSGPAGGGSPSMQRRRDN